MLSQGLTRKDETDTPLKVLASQGKWSLEIGFWGIQFLGNSQAESRTVLSIVFKLDSVKKEACTSAPFSITIGFPEATHPHSEPSEESEPLLHMLEGSEMH